MKKGELFKRPLGSADDLDALAAELERRRRRVGRLLKLWALAGAIVVFVNLADYEPGASPVDRFPGLFVIGFIFVFLVPSIVRARFTHPRLFAAQRRLLEDRRLLPGFDAAVLEADVLRLDERLRRRLEMAGRDPAPLADVTSEALRLCEGLRAADGDETDAHQERQRRRCAAALEAFRAELAAIEAEALLEPRLLAGDGFTRALRRASEHLGGRRRDAGDSPTLGAGPSIAVLPFADLSPEGDQEYFCHGLAEELINALTRIRGLRVVARTSSFAFDGSRRDVREIGRALGVDALVDGSVRKDANRLRVTVQLVRAADGRHLWSERYDRAMGDVFAIQDEITAALIDNLHLELFGGEVPRRRRRVDLEAYHLYLRGRHLWNRRTPVDLEGSVEFFADAVARDPGYALAHAGLADTYNLLGFYSVMAPHDAFPKAITAAVDALDLDHDLAEAHASLAFSKMLYEWDFAGAETSFLRAVELRPGYTTGHHWYSEYLALTGRGDEALAEARIALDLDPLAPIIHTLLGWVHYYSHRFDDAITALERTLEIEPGFAPAELWLALALAETGRLDEAWEALTVVLEQSAGSTLMTAVRGRLEALRGNAVAARQTLAELRDAARERFVPPYHRAAILHALGDDDAALEQLERAVEERDNWVVFLGVDPGWNELRTDPRFQTLVDRVGLA